MRVIIEPDHLMQQAKIWILVDGGTFDKNQSYVFRVRDSETVLEGVPEGARPEPTMTLSERALGALATALADHVPQDQAMAQHLKDAMVTRDKLLSMLAVQIEPRRR